ncbi:hypothetical protein CTRI78_v010815 [Colletotrichum trifolii]|uniref:Uncharacterized protein n=1 Tax=Colletotrichum trifolii TaxID=5466 RepID=A0A4R8QRU6_COLTR|nr:hypothetical protein CTRI78_v010815 [Colletotrichum trifolii]
MCHILETYSKCSQCQQSTPLRQRIRPCQHRHAHGIEGAACAGDSSKTVCTEHVHQCRECWRRALESPEYAYYANASRLAEPEEQRDRGQFQPIIDFLDEQEQSLIDNISRIFYVRHANEPRQRRGIVATVGQKISSLWR